MERKFKHISVGKDGSVWTVGKTDGTVYRLFGDAGAVGFVPDKVGKAEVIAAVDWGNAWCINKDHEIWHLTNAESLDKGGTWTMVSTHSGRADAKTISVGNDGSVWYAQTDGTLFHSAQPGNGTGRFWVKDKVGKAEVIAAIDATSLYCINKDNEIWFGQNGAWSQLTTHSDRDKAKSIAVNPDGYAWYSSTDGAVFRSVRPGDGVGLPPWGTTWNRKEMGKADIIAVGPDDLVWCINTKGEVWRAFDDKWQQLTEHGPDGTFWTYKIKPGDGLLAIVRKEFNLHDPKDTQEIGRLVNLIVAQNGIANSDSINHGETLRLHY
ncbi:MAG: tectonin domain-containing protein [Candidatus Promineifilaceae bacterium]